MEHGEDLVAWSEAPLRFSWYAESLLGTAQFQAASPSEMLENGLAALAALLCDVGTSQPEGVALAVLLGEPRRPQYRWITDLQTGDFAALADWFDHECHRLLGEARTCALEHARGQSPGRR